jgi:hypothetical protein
LSTTYERAGFVPTLIRGGAALQGGGQGVELLDWEGFCRRFFSGGRERHDFEAALAYERYRRSRGAAEPPATVDTGTTVGRALSDWEGEGGSTLPESRSTTTARHLHARARADERWHA